MSRSKLTGLAGALHLPPCLRRRGVRRQQQQVLGDDDRNGSVGGITPPASISSAGKLVFCSDITYPPEEFYDRARSQSARTSTSATSIARRMGVKAQFKNTGFDCIIPALLAKKCDAIISGMNDTPERRKQVDFVDYLKVGQSFMVKKGNPENITSSPASPASAFGRVGDDEQRLTSMLRAKKLRRRGRRRSRSSRSRRTRTRRPR